MDYVCSTYLLGLNKDDFYYIISCKLHDEKYKLLLIIFIIWNHHDLLTII